MTGGRCGGGILDVRLPRACCWTMMHACMVPAGRASRREMCADERVVFVTVLPTVLYENVEFTELRCRNVRLAAAGLGLDDCMYIVCSGLSSDLRSEICQPSVLTLALQSGNTRLVHSQAGCQRSPPKLEVVLLQPTWEGLASRSAVLYAENIRPPTMCRIYMYIYYSLIGSEDCGRGSPGSGVVIL